MIPPRLFFVLLAPMEFTFIHYLAVKSTAVTNPTYKTMLLPDSEPSGVWWDAVAPYVDAIKFVQAPTIINGVRDPRTAHKADHVRLNELHRNGGVYLDLDVISVASLEPLMGYPTVLGGEGKDQKYGLCDAVILAEPASDFITEWLRGYDSATSLWSGFRSAGHDNYWDEMSSLYPAHLARLHPDWIHVADYRAFHYPTWEPADLELLFRGAGDAFPGAYAHHLWESESGAEYLSEITPDRLRTSNTNFSRICQPFLD